MLNYKLQSNITNIGTNYGAEDLYSKDVGPSTFYQPKAMDIDNDTNVEIFNRKKAWAELERE